MLVFKHLKYNLMLSLLVVCCLKAHSQEDTALYTKDFLDSLNINDFFKVNKSNSYFKIQASYLSNSVYGGRKDSALLPYFTPSIEYNHKSGFYASASAALLPKNNFKEDYYSLDIGYSFDTTNKLGGSIYANKIFYTDSSKNVQSNVKFSFGGNINYYTNLLEFVASASLMFGDKTDFSLLLSANHYFYLIDNDKTIVSLNPTFSTYFGSTGFYQTGKTKRRVLGLPPGTTYTITSPKKFQILSYEIAAPINFDKENWGLFFTPTYAFAVNPVITTYSATQRNGVSKNYISTEEISNSFIAELGFYYKF